MMETQQKEAAMTPWEKFKAEIVACGEHSYKEDNFGVARCSGCGANPLQVEFATGKPKADTREPEGLTMDAVAAEVIRARIKFPDNTHKLAALVEEVGELAQAMLQGKPWDEIEKEAIQVAAVAVRIIEEGDSDFPATCAGARQG